MQQIVSMSKRLRENMKFIFESTQVAHKHLKSRLAAQNPKKRLMDMQQTVDVIYSRIKSAIDKHDKTRFRASQKALRLA